MSHWKAPSCSLALSASLVIASWSFCLVQIVRWKARSCELLDPDTRNKHYTPQWELCIIKSNMNLICVLWAIQYQGCYWRSWSVGKASFILFEHSFRHWREYLFQICLHPSAVWCRILALTRIRSSARALFCSHIAKPIEQLSVLINKKPYIVCVSEATPRRQRFVWSYGVTRLYGDQYYAYPLRTMLRVEQTKKNGILRN